MYRAGFEFSYLYPFSTAYYRKFGYESCVQRYACTLDLGLLDPPPRSGSFRLLEPGSSLTDSIRAVDRVWEERFNMAVRHRAEDYAWAEKADPFHTAEYTYVCLNAAGEPTAYTSFKTENQPDGRNLICRRLCFTDRAGFESLLQLFKSLSADHRYAKFDLPAEPAMQYLLPEWSLGAAQWTVKPAGMLRVINVRAALEKARFRGSGDLVLKIRDSFIPENDGSFSVHFSDGRAASVAPTSAEPDAELDIPAFSALIAGVCDVAEAAQWTRALGVGEGA